MWYTEMAGRELWRFANQIIDVSYLQVNFHDVPRIVHSVNSEGVIVAY